MKIRHSLVVTVVTLVALCMFQMSASADAEKEVEISNFPDVQDVAVVNAPPVQDVNITNPVLPVAAAPIGMSIPASGWRLVAVLGGGRLT